MFTLNSYDKTRNVIGTGYRHHRSDLNSLKSEIANKTTNRITLDESKILKAQKLIEGRYPNLFVAAKIAAISGDKASYIKNRAFDDEHYKKMILEFIKKYGTASRQDIDKLLIDKLSNVLDEKQKQNKIKNLIYEMSKKDKTIKNTGSYKKPIWILVQC